MFNYFICLWLQTVANTNLSILALNNATHWTSMNSMLHCCHVQFNWPNCFHFFLLKCVAFASFICCWISTVFLHNKQWLGSTMTFKTQLGFAHFQNSLPDHFTPRWNAMDSCSLPWSHQIPLENVCHSQLWRTVDLRWSTAARQKSVFVLSLAGPCICKRRDPPLLFFLFKI